MTRPNHMYILLTIIFLLLSGCTKVAASQEVNSSTASVIVALPPEVTKTHYQPTRKPSETPSPSPTTADPSHKFNEGHTFVFLNETIPDGSNIQPGQRFTKTWTIKNNGSIPWDEQFTLVLTSSNPVNEKLSSPELIRLPYKVNPGDAITIEIELEAPNQNGVYTVYYALQDNAGNIIPNSQVWVSISVGDDFVAKSRESITAAGVTITVTGFEYNEQTAEINYCIAIHDLLDWKMLREYGPFPAIPQLLIDQKPAPFLEGGSNYSMGDGCTYMQYQVEASVINQAHEILFTFEQMRMGLPPGDPNDACRAAHSALTTQYPGMDFKCSFSMAGYYTDLKTSKGMGRDQANQLIVDLIEGAIYGPWVLKIK